MSSFDSEDSVRLIDTHTQGTLSVCSIRQPVLKKKTVTYCRKRGWAQARKGIRTYDEGPGNLSGCDPKGEESPMFLLSVSQAIK